MKCGTYDLGGRKVTVEGCVCTRSAMIISSPHTTLSPSLASRSNPAPFKSTVSKPL